MSLSPALGGKGRWVIVCSKSAWSTMGVLGSHSDPKKKSLICFERFKHIFKRKNIDFRGPLRKQNTQSYAH